MKKLFALFLALGLILGTGVNTFAGIDSSAMTTEAPAQTDTVAAPAETTEETTEEAPAQVTEDEKESGIHHVIKEKFIEGDPVWMTPVLLCLILGLAVAIERIITLSLFSINKDKFVLEIEEAVKTGGVEAAKEVCRNTRGPIASIFYQGLDRSDEGIEVVEKTIVSYGSVQMGQMEKGMVWLSLFIALAPMLGFMGTVIGMIQAFDQIQAQGDISPTVVAGGIKVALLTTVAGLIVAIFLQLFYNYIVNKVDTMVNNMEEASIDLVDILVKNKISSTK
ncbi:MAG: MotA/TolQ/ExbB proton channel family protein [Bacteroidota bacterium]|nr:MotA/TolQ/ExbB proton channel family protein [Bacteroidota bacterium]MDX5431633.1 MotA/TolQ/ExbB proton channel family protein [Bacteroidota bacterium]MDX5470351.1 MotA/TolQ/ExbB proton channel family protein [Bacteroidota bacterium]